MSKNKTIITLFLLLISTSILSQSKLYSLKKISNKSVLLLKNNKNIDTLSTYGIKGKNTFLKIIKNEVIMSNYVIPSVANFSNAHIVVSKWKIINDKLVGNSTKIVLKKCNIEKIKVYVRKRIVYWKYKKSFFRRIKGVISDKEFELNEYDINCNKL